MSQEKMDMGASPKCSLSADESGLDGSMPQFEHDCERCVYLGRHEDRDVYVCPQYGWPTIVQRFGDRGSEYNSGAWLVEELPREMGDRAVAFVGEWGVDPSKFGPFDSDESERVSALNKDQED